MRLSIRDADNAYETASMQRRRIWSRNHSSLHPLKSHKQHAADDGSPSGGGISEKVDDVSTKRDAPITRTVGAELGAGGSYPIFVEPDVDINSKAFQDLVRIQEVRVLHLQRRVALTCGWIPAGAFSGRTRGTTNANANKMRRGRSLRQFAVRSGVRRALVPDFPPDFPRFPARRTVPPACA